MAKDNSGFDGVTEQDKRRAEEFAMRYITDRADGAWEIACEEMGFPSDNGALRNVFRVGLSIAAFEVALAYQKGVRVARQQSTEATNGQAK